VVMLFMDTAVYLFDDWFDPIEAVVRDRVRGPAACRSHPWAAIAQAAPLADDGVAGDSDLAGDLRRPRWCAPRALRRINNAAMETCCWPPLPREDFGTYRFKGSYPRSSQFHSRKEYGPADIAVRSFRQI
jgi:hypothetical protein